MQKVKLRNEIEMPAIGLGTWKITNREEMLGVIKAAFQTGYRLFDTAAAYSNEMVFGRAINDLQLPREEIFIQDKLWNTCYGYAEAQEACKRSLKKLKTEYLDAYLIHWPASPKLYENWAEINAETWRGMERLYQEGYVKAIGVSNFKIHHLLELEKSAGIMPLINQVECHPGMPQEELSEFCKPRGIQLEASSPLGNGQLLTNEILCSIAESKNISVSRLCLGWERKRNFVVLPKTTKPERMMENLQIEDFELTEDEMRQISQLPFCGGLGIDSDEVTSIEGL